MNRKLLLALLLGSLLACATITRAEDAEVDDDDEEDDMEERAYLLVRRKVADERPLEGMQTSVTISIFNAGNTEAAKGVELVESAWPAEFEVLGELTAAFDSIPAGSSVQHTYKVTGKQASVYRHPATIVTYTPAEEEDLQTATSEVLTFRTFTIIASITSQALEWGSYLTGGSFNTPADWLRLAYFVGAAALALFAYRSYGSVSAANASRKRAKALAALGELEKDK